MYDPYLVFGSGCHFPFSVHWCNNCSSWIASHTPCSTSCTSLRLVPDDSSSWSTGLACQLLDFREWAVCRRSRSSIADQRLSKSVSQTSNSRQHQDEIYCTVVDRKLHRPSQCPNHFAADPSEPICMSDISAPYTGTWSRDSALSAMPCRDVRRRTTADILYTGIRSFLEHTTSI